MTLDTLMVDQFDGSGGITRERNDAHLGNLLDDLSYRWEHWPKPAADGAASTATAEVPMFHAPVKTLVVKSVRFIPAAALTADSTNFATITVRKRTATGADGGVVASRTTALVAAGGSGDWVAFRSVLFNLGTALTMSLGESLTVAITKSGTGVVVPAGVLRVGVR